MSDGGTMAGVSAESDPRRSSPSSGSPFWWLSKDGDAICKRLYDRHYSRRIYRDGREPKLFCGPGEKIILRTWGGDALWVWRRFKDASGQEGVNCAVFRNESTFQSSELVRQADAVADFCWPGVRHYTYVNAGRIRSTNPGCCFKTAGWTLCGTTKGGLMILERPARYGNSHNGGKVQTAKGGLVIPERPVPANNRI